MSLLTRFYSEFCFMSDVCKSLSFLDFFFIFEREKKIIDASKSSVYYNLYYWKFLFWRFSSSFFYSKVLFIPQRVLFILKSFIHCIYKESRLLNFYYLWQKGFRSSRSARTYLKTLKSFRCKILYLFQRNIRKSIINDFHWILLYERFQCFLNTFVHLIWKLFTRYDIVNQFNG